MAGAVRALIRRTVSINLKRISSKFTLYTRLFFLNGVLYGDFRDFKRLTRRPFTFAASRSNFFHVLSILKIFPKSFLIIFEYEISYVWFRDGNCRQLGPLGYGEIQRYNYVREIRYFERVKGIFSKRILASVNLPILKEFLNDILAFNENSDENSHFKGGLPSHPILYLPLLLPRLLPYGLSKKYLFSW